MSEIKMVKKKISLLLFIVGAFTVQAAQISVKVSLDSAYLLMGKTTLLNLEVVKEKNTSGGLPILSALRQGGLIGLCGDSVEMSPPQSIDTIELGSGKIQINYKIPIQAFDSGYYHLPEFLYVSGNDSILSNRVALKVIPVDVTAEDPISDFAPISDPDGKSFFDFLPDALIDYWWIWLLIIILLVGGLYLSSIYKKRGTLLPVKQIVISPYERAMRELKALKEKKLWENGMEREYFTELTEILRIYLEGRFHINAIEMTTTEIIRSLSENKDVKEKRSYMKDILDMADFVKFAKVRPLPADNISAYDKAVSFVEETKPTELSTDQKEAGKEGNADA